MRQIGRRRASSSGFASAGIAAIDNFADFLVIHKLASIGSGQALVDLAQKPVIVVQQALHRFQHQRFRGAALLISGT
jgi:hypothetical protein